MLDLILKNNKIAWKEFQIKIADQNKTYQHFQTFKQVKIIKSLLKNLLNYLKTKKTKKELIYYQRKVWRESKKDIKRK